MYPARIFRGLLILAPIALIGAAFASAPRRDDAMSADGDRVTPPLPAAAPLREERATHVVTIPWGSGPGAVGRRRPAEGSPEGPMTFVVDANGAIHVLDQVNSRVVTWSAAGASHTTKLPSETIQDLEIDAAGRYVLLDRHRGKSVVTLDRAGKVVSEVPLLGLGIREGASATALFSRPDGTWVEIEHGSLIRIARADGSPDPARLAAPGRFGAGRWFRAERAGRNGVLVSTPSSLGKTSSPFARLDFHAPVGAITALEIGEGNRAYVGVWLLDQATGVDEQRVIALGDSGAPIASVTLPSSPLPEETFRAVRMGKDGALYAMTLTEQGAELWRWQP